MYKGEKYKEYENRNENKQQIRVFLCKNGKQFDQLTGFLYYYLIHSFHIFIGINSIIDHNNCEVDFLVESTGGKWLTSETTTFFGSKQHTHTHFPDNRNRLVSRKKDVC